MSRSSAPGPMLLLAFGLASIALTLSACSPAAPKDDAVQSSAQSSAEDTDQSASQIGNCRIIPLSGVNPDTLEEFCELFPQLKTIPNDVLLEELTKEVEYAETMGITPEEFFRHAIEAVRRNDEAMRRATEEASGEAPVQSH